MFLTLLVSLYVYIISLHLGKCLARTFVNLGKKVIWSIWWGETPFLVSFKFNF
jgi:hypothetical protein